MHLSYPSDTTLHLRCPRKIGPYLALVVLVVLGGGFAAGVALSDPSALRLPMALFGLGSLGFGVYGIITNASETLTLDATSRTATLHRRSLAGTRVRQIPFDDIRDVLMIGDRETQTVGLLLPGPEVLPVEHVTLNRPRVGDTVHALRDWLTRHGVSLPRRILHLPRGAPDGGH